MMSSKKIILERKLLHFDETLKEKLFFKNNFLYKSSFWLHYFFFNKRENLDLQSDCTAFKK